MSALLETRLGLPLFVKPAHQGSSVGIVKVTLDAKPMGEYPLVALAEVPLASLFGRAWDTVRLWFK